MNEAREVFEPGDDVYFIRGRHDDAGNIIDYEVLSGKLQPFERMRTGSQSLSSRFVVRSVDGQHLYPPSAYRTETEARNQAMALMRERMMAAEKAIERRRGVLQTLHYYYSLHERAAARQ